MIRADASKVTPSEFLNAVLGPREPQEVKRVRYLASIGKTAEAREYLDALNRIQRAFGHPEYVVELGACTDLTAKVEAELRFTVEQQARAA